MKKLLSMSIAVASVSAAFYVSNAVAETIVDQQKSTQTQKSKTMSSNSHESADIIQKAKLIVAKAEQDANSGLFGNCRFLSDPKDVVDYTVYDKGWLVNFGQKDASELATVRDIAIDLASINGAKAVDINTYQHYFMAVVAAIEDFSATGANPNIASMRIPGYTAIQYKQYTASLATGQQTNNVVTTDYAHMLSELTRSIPLMAYRDVELKIYLQTMATKYGINLADATERNAFLIDIKMHSDKYASLFRSTNTFFGSSAVSVSLSKDSESFLVDRIKLPFGNYGSHAIANPFTVYQCAMAETEAVADAAKMIAAGAKIDTIYRHLIDDEGIKYLNAIEEDKAVNSSVHCRVASVVAAMQGQIGKTPMVCDNGFVYTSEPSPSVTFAGMAWLTNDSAKGVKYSYDKSEQESNTKSSSTNSSQHKKIVQ